MSALEQHYCPDHAHTMPGMPAYDEWETERWRSGRPSDSFPEGVDHPRTCSYCGGVHPEDVLKMVEQGWDVEMSTKSYKAYLQPPGYLKWMAYALGATATEHEWVESPVPPAKIYFSHFTEEQRQRLITALQSRGKN